jgi:hypothetical protein
MRAMFNNHNDRPALGRPRGTLRIVGTTQANWAVYPCLPSTL